MAKNATPVSTSERLRAGREAARRKREDERAAKDAEIARLTAELAKKDGKDLPNESRDEVRDDLDWITPDVHSVAFVSRHMTICLRPAKPGFGDTFVPISMNHTGYGPWDAMPFDIRSNDADLDRRVLRERINRATYATWAYHRLSRALAEEMYADARWPIPKEAVVSGKEFKGFDRQVQRAVGKHRVLVAPDPLREAARRVLQRLAGSTYVDVRFHKDAVLAYADWCKSGRKGFERGLNPSRPNPYGTSLGSLVAKLQPPPTETEIRL